MAITVEPPDTLPFSLLLRVPGWAQNKPVPGDLHSYVNAAQRDIVLKINGSITDYVIDEKGYIVLRRTRQPDDKVEISFPMDVRRTVADSAVNDAVKKKGRHSINKAKEKAPQSFSKHFIYIC